MTVPGIRKRTRQAGDWWRAQKRDWPIEQRRRYIASLLPIEPEEQPPIVPPERTVPVEIKGTNAKTGRPQVVAVTVRRVSDARLWDSFTPDEEWAAELIRDAFATLDRGLGVKPVSTEARVSGGRLSYGPEFTNAVVAYFDWATECVRRRIDHSAIMDVLGYGKSCRETERQRRKRNGYVRQQIAEGLALYLAQQGRPIRTGAA